jgi:hypothetical protein
MRTTPISQVDIENELMRLMDRLEDETEQFETVAMDLAKKEALYKSNWAKEYLSAKGSIKEREAWADYKLDQQLFEYKCAEAIVKAKREALLSIRSSMDAIRTLNANVRTQV